jgi:hypothetical protein
VTTETLTSDDVVRHFIKHMFTIPHSLHVRRVTGWLGLLACAIELRKDDWRLASARRLEFRVGRTWFVVQFKHKLDMTRRFNRGGVVIINKATGRVVRAFKSLTDCSHYYQDSIIDRVQRS